MQENRNLEEVKDEIKKAKNALEAAMTANERELILKQLNLLYEQKNLLLTHILAPPRTTGTYEFLLIKKSFLFVAQHPY